MNEVVERDMDALMRRTALRPLVTGSMSLLHGHRRLRYDLRRRALSWPDHQLAHRRAAALTSVIYLAVYTPLKQVSPSAPSSARFPAPCRRCWAGRRFAAAWTWKRWCYLRIVFFWQFPHFHSIALLYREDYENARIRMLPVVESDGRSTASPS